MLFQYYRFHNKLTSYYCVIIVYYSIRTLVLAEPGSPLAVTSKQNKNYEGIHLDAGADLLNYYQFHWCRIREASEHNFRLADVLSFNLIPNLSLIQYKSFYFRLQTKQY